MRWPGGDTVIVVVPGLGLGEATCAPLRRALQSSGAHDDRTLVRVLPGYGERAGRHEDLAPESLARRLVAKHLSDGRRHVLVGHSASCQVVVHAAAQAPDRVAGLVLIGPTTDPRADTWARLARRWFATAAHEPPWQIPLLVREYSRTGLMNMARAMDAARRDRIDRVLEGLSCWVVVVRGIEDRIVPRDWAEGLVAGMPAGSAVTLPVGGHMLPLTHPALLAGEIVDAFRRTGSL